MGSLRSNCYNSEICTEIIEKILEIWHFEETCVGKRSRRNLSFISVLYRALKWTLDHSQLSIPRKAPMG